MENFGRAAQLFPESAVHCSNALSNHISSFKDAKLLSIGENGVEELSGAYAYSIDDVVEYKQGSFGIPQELRRLKQEFEDAFCLRDRENSQKAVDKMKELFGTSNTEVKRAEAKMQMRKNWN